MQKVSTTSLHVARLIFVLLVLLLCSAPCNLAHAQAPKGPPPGDKVKGEALFKASCAGCHGISEERVGPALGIPNPEIEALGVPYVLKWVQNPGMMIDKKDPYALKIYQKYNQQIMPSFPNITAIDLLNLKTYIDDEYAKSLATPKPAPAQTDPVISPPSQSVTSGNRAGDGCRSLLYVLGGVSILFFCVCLVLNGVIVSLVKTVRDLQNK